MLTKHATATLLLLFVTGCLLFLQVAVLFAASRQVASPSSDPVPENVVRVPFFTVEKGFKSGVRERKFVVITTAQKWKELWLTHRSGVFSDSEPPQIDLQQEMIVAAFAGEKGTGGYSIEIREIRQDTGKQVKVFWEETYPLPDSPVIQALTQPYHIVRLRRLDLPVAFGPLVEKPQQHEVRDNSDKR